MIRAFIPGLYNPQTRSPFLSQEDQTTFYEQGFLPAVKELCADRSAEWPARYTDEMFRARGRNGTLSFQSKMIPQWNVEELGSTIRRKLTAAGIPWSEGILFLHQIRGTKDSSYHSVTHNAAQQALEEFLSMEDLDLQTITSTGRWWIDVGVQVTSTDKNCLAWRSDSHGRIVQELCQVTERAARSLTSIGSSQYTRDMTSHLPQVSGCRIQPGVRAQGPYGVAYLQLYCTDKAITYRLDQGHYGKFITCRDVVKGKEKHFIEDLYGLYINAIDNNYAQARMELRVPIEFATQALVDFNTNTICNGLLLFPSVEWWYVLFVKFYFILLTTAKQRSLRAYRAKAIQLVLGWQAEGKWELRASMQALLLTAGCVWLLNGLHSAPDNGPASRNLMDCILPEIYRRGADEMLLAYGRAVDDANDEMDDDDYDGRFYLPGNPYGLVFLNSLRIGQRHPVPRLQKNKSLSDRSFEFLFGIAFRDIDESFFRSSSIHSGPLNRSRNRVRRTERYVPDDDAPEANLFNVETRGVQLLPRARDEGSDLEDQDEDTEDEEGIDAQLTNLWRQFIKDVLQTVPNRSRGDEDGYCRLDAEERVVGEDLFKNLCLSDFFNDCQWRVGDQGEWDTVFDHLFPVKDKARRVQNYNASHYYSKWQDIRRRAEKRSLDTIRKALKTKFKTLLWFPFAQADRIWPTKTTSNRFKKFLAVNKPAPWVICRRAPTWR